MLYLLEGMTPFRNLEAEMRNLRGRTDSISKQLGGWAGSLQDSGFKGRRYVNAKTRRAEEKARDRQEFLQRLEAIRTHSGAKQEMSSVASGPAQGLSPNGAQERSPGQRPG